MLVIVSLMVILNLLFAYVFAYPPQLRKTLNMPLAIGFVFALTTPSLLVCREWKRKWFPLSLDIALISVWSAAVWIVGAQMVQVAARAPFPLVDAKLAHLDGFLIQTATVVQWAQRYPWLHKASLFSYRLLSPMAVAALFVPVLVRRTDVARRYVLSVSISILTMLAVFAFQPAAGPWTVEDFPASKAQVSVQHYLLAVKSGNSNGIEEQGDIVAFPSFHVILAVLAGLSLFNVKGLRYVSLAVATAICLSTATTGWHYVVDIIAGLAIAVTCHYLALALLRRRQTRVTAKPASDNVGSDHNVLPRLTAW
jgi:membrane-associated phospholipid phosphatase